jgi:uncharacterized membrane protein YphA (DoxX/SURF4 family)
MRRIARAARLVVAAPLVILSILPMKAGATGVYENAAAEPAFLPLNNGGTAAILFCFACLYLATSGPGPISVDAQRK